MPPTKTSQWINIAKVEDDFPDYERFENGFERDCAALGG